MLLAILIAVAVVVVAAVIAGVLTYRRLCDRLLARDVALGKHYKGVGRKAALVLVEAERVLAEAERINAGTELGREDMNRLYGHIGNALSDRRVQHLLDHAGESQFDAIHARINDLAAAVDGAKGE